MCIAVVICLLIGALAVSSFAAASSPADTYVSTLSGTTAFGTTDSAHLQVNSGGLGVCNFTETVYLRWSLSGVNDAVGPSTQLKLTVNDAQAGNTGSLSLYRVADDSWNEATVTNDTPAPTVGLEITSVPIPTTSPAPVTFTGQELADYLAETTAFANGSTDMIAGDDVASFAVRVTGCRGFTNPVRFDAREGSGTAPLLNLFNPTAITLTALTAGARPETPLARYALFASLIGLAAAAVVWLRRR